VVSSSITYLSIRRVLSEGCAEALELTRGASVNDFVSNADDHATEEAGINLGVDAHRTTVNSSQLVSQRLLLSVVEINRGDNVCHGTALQLGCSGCQCGHIVDRIVLGSTDDLECEGFGDRCHLAVQHLGQQVAAGSRLLSAIGEQLSQLAFAIKDPAETEQFVLHPAELTLHLRRAEQGATAETNESGAELAWG